MVPSWVVTVNWFECLVWHMFFFYIGCHSWHIPLAWGPTQGEHPGRRPWVIFPSLTHQNTNFKTTKLNYQLYIYWLLGRDLPVEKHFSKWYNATVYPVCLFQLSCLIQHFTFQVILEKKKWNDQLHRYWPHGGWTPCVWNKKGFGHSDFANGSVGTRAEQRTTSTLIHTHSYTIEQHTDVTHDRKTDRHNSRHWETAANCTTIREMEGKRSESSSEPREERASDARPASLFIFYAS